MKIEKWNKSDLGEMSFENICRLYSSDKNIQFEKKPPLIRAFTAFDQHKRFEIRWNSYRAETNFSGSMTIAKDLFVLNGKCEITIEEKTVKLQKGEWCEFTKCEYGLKVIGDDDFEFVSAYKLHVDFSVFK